MRIPICNRKNEIVAHSVVDSSEFERLSQFKWRISVSGYVLRGEKGKKIYLHKEVCAKDGFETDHINGDKMDNRSVNLRVCTHTENNRNMSLSKRNKSGHKGVSWDKDANMWRLRFIVKGKNIASRVFKDKVEAAKEYNRLATLYFGEFAKLNQV